MTLDQIHKRITTLADEVDNMYALICDGLPTDEEGFPKPENPDLSDALRMLQTVSTTLSRLAFNLHRDLR